VFGPLFLQEWPLAAAGVVLAATARAPCYRVSRSMINNATSRAVVSASNVTSIGPSFLRAYDPGTTEGEDYRDSMSPTTAQTLRSS
jgi:hypothetical protein